MNVAAACTDGGHIVSSVGATNKTMKTKETQTIHFTKNDNNTDEITAWYSVKMTGYYFGLSVKKISRAIDSIVHTYAWMVMILVVLISFLVSSVFIHLARAERDQANQRQYKLEQQVESMKCQLEAENEQGR